MSSVRVAFLLMLLSTVMLPVCGCGGLRIASERFTVKADDGFELVAFREFEWRGPESARRQARGVFMFIDGPRDIAWMDPTEQLAGAAAMGFDVLRTCSRLPEPAQQPRPDGWDLVSSERVLADESQVLDAYLCSHAGRRPVILIGAGLGCEIAIELAIRDARVTHLVLLGCGGGLTARDELLSFTRLHVGPSRAPAPIEARDIDLLVESARGRWRRGQPPLFDRILLVPRPILTIHGTLDSFVPVESARELQRKFRERGRENLTYREYEGVNESFVHAATGRAARPLIEIDLVNWLASNHVIDPRSADRFVTRVKRAHPEWYAVPKPIQDR